MPNKLDLTNLFTYSVSYSLVINEQCLGELTQGKPGLQLIYTNGNPVLSLNLKKKKAKYHKTVTLWV